MKAKYYRYLFHPVTEGLCYSGSMTSQMQEEKEEFTFLYLAGGEVCQESGTSYTASENAYDLLILGDFSPAAVERACRAALSCRLTEVMMPEAEKEKEYQVMQRLKEAGARQIRVIKEEVVLHRCRELLQIVPVMQKDQPALLCYHADEAGIPEKEECILSVKSVIDGMTCIARADHEKLACEMRCMLYRDFTLCKRHNQRSQKQFMDGHLLFALSGRQKESEKTLAEELVKQHRERIRFIGFSDKALTVFEAKRLSEAGRTGFARYMIGTADTPSEVIKEMVTGDPDRHFLMVGKQAGLCISGYYVPREK